MPSKKKGRMQQTNVKRNQKRIRKMEKIKKRRCLANSGEKIKAAWDSTKTVKQNLKDFGLAFNPNDVIPVKKGPQPTMIPEDEVVFLNPKKPKPEVVEEMVTEASYGEKEIGHELPIEDLKFVTHMILTHKDNYKAMARDRKNVYQLTPKQLRNKVRQFKRTRTQYQEFLKANNLADNEVTMEES